jgi:hypothetical protein
LEPVNRAEKTSVLQRTTQHILQSAPTETAGKLSLLHWTILAVAALLLRIDTFGDPNLHGDETFYLTVGIAMRHGAMPYVDIWDRKPFGLFAIYWLIAGISADPLAYQIAATLCAVATAGVIGMLCADRAGRLGSLLAGLAYLLLLAPLQGFGGQAAVFYNLFIALAALLVRRALPALRCGERPAEVALAMLLGGLAITIKTTAVFEAGFLGLFAAAIALRVQGLRRGGTFVLGWTALGLLPSAAIAAGYANAGHFAEFWHAMVTANVDKAPPDLLTSSMRAAAMTLLLAPLLLAAILALVKNVAGERRFLFLWLVAAVVGLLSVPNFYPHYGLPIIVPLCIAAAPVLERRPLGWILIAMIAINALAHSTPFDFSHRNRSRAAIATLAQDIRASDHGRGLLLYDAPPLLYPLSGRRPLTPLVFPTHFAQLIERNVSHLDTSAELRRVLALKPDTVVMATQVRNGPDNLETRALIDAYIARCRRVAVVQAYERSREDPIAVYADCPT